MRFGRAHAEFCILVASGIAVLATARVQWIASGAGSRFDGLELADNLRDGAVVPDRGKWVAAALYAVIALGGLMIASSALRHRAIAAARLLGSVLLVGGLAVPAVLGWFPIGRWSTGPTAVAVAALVTLGVSVGQLVDSSRNDFRTAPVSDDVET